MSSFFFRYSAMNSGKTSNLIQAAYNYRERGMEPIIFTSALDNRYGTDKVASRVGLEMPAIAITSDDDLLQKFIDLRGSKTCAVFVDEAQFLTEDQVHQLATIVDDHNIPVLCYGLRTDFMGELFPGSKALLAIADKLEELKSICFCGRKATMNARLTDSTEQISVGGNESYISMCRKHHKEHLASKGL